MSSATVSRMTSQKPIEVGVCGVAAAAIILAGCLVCYDNDGYLLDGADTAGYRFAGVAREDVDNTDGSDGTLTGTFFRRGAFKVASSGLSADDVGKPVFLVDNQTVGLLGNASVDNGIYVGRITEYVSATVCWVEIDPGGYADVGDGDVVEVTLSADRTLLITSAECQRLDPNGASRNITLPAPENSREGKRKRFHIVNTASSANNLVIKNAAGSTILTLNQNESAFLYCDGTNWKHGGILTHAAS